ncbi:hypothetical protein ACFS2C_13350 [Prauserella oleivorans]|uniref:Uncharacterized protein n=1 Tax=Prauserella oleivorans TaxID=1478153 RepID=A0ABW5W8T5_9PSEU
MLVAAAHWPVPFTAVNGISSRVLTLTLRKLRRDGPLVRAVHPTPPVE